MFLKDLFRIVFEDRIDPYGLVESEVGVELRVKNLKLRM